HGRASHPWTSRLRSIARSPTSAACDRSLTPATSIRRYAGRIMADPRRVELDDLVNRPGTYFNPQTDVLVVVDDSPELDSEIFNMEEYEGADWVLISDEVPVEENRRDELLEAFQVKYGPGSGTTEDEDEDEFEEEIEDVGREGSRRLTLWRQRPRVADAAIHPALELALCLDTLRIDPEPPIHLAPAHLKR